jgi:hypothetical protein
MEGAGESSVRDHRKLVPRVNIRVDAKMDIYNVWFLSYDILTTRSHWLGLVLQCPRIPALQMGAMLGSFLPTHAPPYMNYSKRRAGVVTLDLLNCDRVVLGPDTESSEGAR